MGESTKAKNGELEGRRLGAFVTFLAGNGEYVKGVIALAKGLRKANSRHPLVVALLPDVPLDHRKMLVAQGCLLREIQPVYPPPGNAHASFARDYYTINYSKLRIWEFTEYSKVIYLDGDIQVFDNIDHLFDLPNGYLYGVTSCFCEKHWSQYPFYKVGYCQLGPKSARWSDEFGPNPPHYINAGMLVFEPDMSTYHHLLLRLMDNPPTAFAEQDFLNMYFKERIKAIPNVYNFLIQMLWRHPEVVEFENIKVVHYCINGSKPWRYTGKEENMEREDVKKLVNKWWHIYNDDSLSIPSSGSPRHTPELVDTPLPTFPAPSAT